ncbi:uncharacterized protein LOC129576009 isoform X3 [Sitodiplosis mosellana]|uniref:uncharacterized protein LOC129576009 isoform X3 n=1 Tax=Sitodiplosis mosellana TaxID=263140 RepID=UPI002445025C|nr:uncharacterized protein LOC129576009 isoform X3 [Sitodiplosis mosellana]
MSHCARSQKMIKMSSSLLLDNFVIQEQRQPTQNKASTYHFYKEHEQEYYEQTSNYVPPIQPPPPPLSSSQPPITNAMPTSQTKLKKCNCCPYGFHIDLDFIRYCEELAANGKSPSRKQLDRRNKRRQRKSLEVMLGFEDQWVLDFEKESHPAKQRKSDFETVYEVIGEVQQKASSPYDNVDYKKEPCERNKKNIGPEQGDFVNNILFDVYSDFERTLERASGRSGQKGKEKSSCISGHGEGRHDAYGHEKQLETVHYTTNSADISPASYTRQITSNNVHQQNVSIEEVHEQIHITETTRSVPKRTHQHQDDRNESVETGSKSLPSDIYSAEIDQLSLANRNLSDQLQSVRNQLSDNLTRVRDFEERVKQIPKLQLELSVEKAENRDLHLKLKALQNALERKEQHELRMAAEMAEKTKMDSSTAAKLDKHIARKNHHICATSLESLNIRFQNSSSSLNESQQLHTNTGVSSSSIQTSTQNVGCMTNKTLSRDVGVVTIPVLIPTRTMAINTDISAKNPFDETQKKPILKSVSVQSEHEPRTLTKSAATITDREPSPPRPPEKHSVAVLAIPNVCNSSCMARPEVRSIGLDNIYEKIRTRSFGTDPIKQLEEKQSDSPISLKLLDAPKSNITPLTSSRETGLKLPEIPKEFRSIGVQQSPNVENKFSQCVEKLVEPPPLTTPPKVQTQTGSTDTSDLTLHIHRGVNTDALLPKKHRLTNTDQILTDNKSTNTDRYATVKETTKAESSENVSKSTLLNEHQCHNCLAKIEIKQRTIIKNPNKIENVPSNISTTASMTKTTTETTTTETTSTNETINEEMSSTTQSSDLQSRIPRPTALISPRSEKKFTRQNTYTIPSSPISSSQLAAFQYTDASVSQCPAEAYLISSCGGTSTSTTSTVKANTTQTHSNISQTSTYRSHDIENRSSDETTAVNDSTKAHDAAVTGASGKTTTAYNTDDDESLWSRSMKSSSTYSQLASSVKPRHKVTPSKEMQAALKVINDKVSNESLPKGQHLATTLKNANKIVQKEWFRISSTENAQPFEVEDYLDCFEEYSPNLLKYIVNSTDANGNTAMHYAVSHGNFDVVSILLDSKVCDINATNNAGYTCVMLVSLAKLDVAEHQTVVQRLFQMSDVNVRAKKHSQTALMLATSHGNYNMVRMLLDAGADINIQDEDGSTALMCAAEHGRMEIIKILLAQSECDSTVQDLDGSTALKISLEAGYRDIGVLLYAHEYMTKNKSPYTSLRSGGRSRKHSSSLTSSTNALHGHVSSNTNIVGTTNSSEVSNVENTDVQGSSSFTIIDGMLLMNGDELWF